MHILRNSNSKFEDINSKFVWLVQKQMSKDN